MTVECGGCGSMTPEDDILECPWCGGNKCSTCDMGDDVECPSCGSDDEE